MIAIIQPDTKLPKMKKIRTYTALLTQASTDAPTAEILQNTLGFTPTWTRTGLGQYEVINEGKYPADKVFLIVSNSFGKPGQFAFLSYNDGNTLLLEHWLGTDNSYRDNFVDLMIEIRIYDI